jgi:hypothetical protein
VEEQCAAPSLTIGLTSLSHWFLHKRGNHDNAGDVYQCLSNKEYEDGYPTPDRWVLDKHGTAPAPTIRPVGVTVPMGKETLFGAMEGGE